MVLLLQAVLYISLFKVKVKKKQIKVDKINNTENFICTGELPTEVATYSTEHIKNKIFQNMCFALEASSSFK